MNSASCFCYFQCKRYTNKLNVEKGGLIVQRIYTVLVSIYYIFLVKEFLVKEFAYIG